MQDSLIIAPSILSADFSRLGEDIRGVEQAGADWIHIDVMDGHFVPNLTIGPAVVQSIRPRTQLPFDVHLMIEHPDRYIADFAKAGADYITVQAEASDHLHRTLKLIRSEGARAGVALNPATPLEVVEYVVQELDLILIMTVNPGFGGQSFIPEMLPKIRKLRSMLQEKNKQHIMIEVDGGINAETAPLAAEAGARVLVAGSAIFNREDRAAAITALRKQEGQH